MKILIFDTAPLTYFGGFEGNIIDLGRHLSKFDMVSYLVSNQLLANTISVLTQQHRCEIRTTQEYVSRRSEGIHINEYGILSLIPFTPNYFKARSLLQKADVIYGKNEVLDILLMRYLLAFSKKTPSIICGVHTPIFYPKSQTFRAKLHNYVYTSFIYKILMSGINLRFLTLNAYDQWTVLNTYGNKNVALIPNGIDTHKFNFIPKQNDSKFVVLFAGRFTEQKGLDTLISSINILSEHDAFSGMEFWFAGSGKLEIMVRELTSRLRNAKWLGHMDDIVTVYQKSSIVVAPSRCETFCFTVAEAQSCGLPVITTNIPGPKDIVIDTITGFIIEPDNDASLANRMLSFYSMWKNNPRQFNEFCDSARKNIVDKFSIDTTVAATRDFFYKQI